MKGLGGFPELQIPRFQKHQFQFSLLPGFCGVSSLVFFQQCMLKVVVIPGKFEQFDALNFRILNITLGLMKKYIAFYEAKREIAKYADNMKDFLQNHANSSGLHNYSV